MDSTQKDLLKEKLVALNLEKDLLRERLLTKKLDNTFAPGDDDVRFPVEGAYIRCTDGANKRRCKSMRAIRTPSCILLRTPIDYTVSQLACSLVCSATYPLSLQSLNTCPRIRIGEVWMESIQGRISFSVANWTHTLCQNKQGGSEFRCELRGPRDYVRQAGLQEVASDDDEEVSGGRKRSNSRGSNHSYGGRSYDSVESRASAASGGHDSRPSKLGPIGGAIGAVGGAMVGAVGAVGVVGQQARQSVVAGAGRAGTILKEGANVAVQGAIGVKEGVAAGPSRAVQHGEGASAGSTCTHDRTHVHSHSYSLVLYPRSYCACSRLRPVLLGHQSKYGTGLCIKVLLCDFELVCEPGTRVPDLKYDRIEIELEVFARLTAVFDKGKVGCHTMPTRALSPR
jgi:hypothetical protein